MARPNVPKFGNWDSENNTPYTVYFENARKNRGGKMINPNDPEENPDMFPEYAPPAPRPKSSDMRRLSKEEGDFRVNSPARSENNSTRGRVVNEPMAHQRPGGGARGSNPGRPTRPSAESNHSVQKSPLHPNSQAKVTGRVAASPARQGNNNNSYDSSHGTPGRSFESARATPGRYQMKQESPDRGAVVPKFGEWDDNDPESAENYTEVFTKVRDERNVGAGNGLGTPTRTSYNTQRQQQNEKQKSCCFRLW